MQCVHTPAALGLAITICVERATIVQNTPPGKHFVSSAYHIKLGEMAGVGTHSVSVLRPRPGSLVVVVCCHTTTYR